jgi:hypothetical protein
MNLSLLSTCELWRRLNPLSSDYDRDEKRRAAIVAELRARHGHLVTNNYSIPYPWELHV